MKLLQLLLREVPFEREELLTIIATASRRYKVYQIPKRDGKSVRTIAQPAPEVKLLQRILHAELIEKWPVHEAATAYVADQSIADHARHHVKSKYLLKLDFKNFFPSITAADIRQHAKRNSNLEEDDLDIFVNIVAWRNKLDRSFGLSIGAPSSPAISNSMMFEFDTCISSYCREREVTYSRYADDLAFSTMRKDTLKEVEAEVHRLTSSIQSPKLAINDKKTVNVSKRYRRSLVGLTITPNQKVSLGRERKRDIRAKLYLYGKGYLNGENVAHLRGLLAYAWSIEPEFVLSLANKQGNELFAKLELPFRSLKD
ncbi:retron St85 family RNA-directed DNA polymerase [Rhodoferax sp.]|jgi:RNA-directed DNA polymerase|uniref:retron St85 family RNA-directed DNA polymerase n=1 Tax=Rhodoferax sp. TaxID=50421 RepID=UPI0037834846